MASMTTWYEYVADGEPTVGNLSICIEHQSEPVVHWQYDVRERLIAIPRCKTNKNVAFLESTKLG